MRIVLLAAAAMTLASCGGGGTSTPVPTPAPTPTPAPVPVPTPTPTPATHFDVEGGGALISRIDLHPSGVIEPGGGGDYFLYFTNRQGEFYLGQPDRIFPGGITRTLTDDHPIYALLGLGIDRASSQFVAVNAPIGATVASPLTSLIFATGDQPLVKHALQLFGGNFQLATDIDLRTFSAAQNLASTDAFKHDTAARLTASNIRLLALSAAVDDFLSGPGSQTDYPSAMIVEPQRIATYLKANPATVLYANAGTGALLTGLQAVAPDGQHYRDDVIAGAANLIDAYAIAIGGGVEDNETAGRYMLGIQGYLLPMLRELRAANSASAAAAASAVSAADVTAATAVFRNTVPLATGNFFPAPDFFRIGVNARRTLPASNGGNSGTQAIIFNDGLFVSNGPGAGGGGSETIVSITVPAANAANIAATLQPDQSVAVESLGGFTGVTWFDYTARAGGETAVGRVYLIVR